MTRSIVLFVLAMPAFADDKPYPKPDAKAADVSKGEWFGQRVLPKRRIGDIKMGNWIDGKQQEWMAENLLNCQVREDRDGFVRVFDGRREGWIRKDDMVLLADAPAYYETVLKDAPRDYLTLHLRSIAWLNLKQFDKAMDDLNSAIDIESSLSDLYTSRGNVWYAKKDYEKALDDYDKAIQLNPTAASYNNRGLAWYENKFNDKAIADFNEALRLDPKYVPAIYHRGNAWYRKKDFDKAIADCTEALKLDPNHVNALLSRALAWKSKKDLDKAYADYTEVIRIDPKSAVARLKRGELSEARKEYDKALADYDALLQIDPKSPMLYEIRAAAWAAKKEYAKAVAEYTEAIKLDSKNAILFHHRATVLRWQKEYDLAIADYKDAILLVPNYATALSDLAWLLSTCPVDKHRDGKQAVEYARQVVKLYPKLWKSYAVLASSLAEAGDFDEAVKEQKKTIEMMKAVDRINKEELKKAEERLTLFEAKKPSREMHK